MTFRLFLTSIDPYMNKLLCWLFFATYCVTAEKIISEFKKLDESETFFYHGIEYTPAKAADEITNKTPVGMEFVKNYIDGMEGQSFNESALESYFYWEY